MKINISEDEVYELSLPEEVNNPEEFYAILKKLDNVAKIIKINLMTDTTFNKFKSNFQDRESEKKARKKYTFNKHTFNNPNSRRANENPFLNTEEKVLDLLQYAYHGNREDRKRISKLMGRTWNDICKGFNSLFIRYPTIKPSDIGLIGYPSQLQRGKDLRIPNYIIKSHTGIFDEK